LRELLAIEGKLLQLLRGLPEILTQSPVVLDELRVVQNQVLAHDALQRDGLLVELAARASGLRCLQYRLLALRAEPIEAYDQFNQRVQKRQTDQQETEQDELEE